LSGRAPTLTGGVAGDQGRSRAGWRPDLLALGLLAGHLVLVWSLRTVAWPELTTPAYLWSRGLLLYRDVKFQHSPGAIGALALAFLLFGVKAAVIRVFAAAGPLVAHMYLLRQTRLFRPLVRVASSAFFVVGICAYHGNAVWPTVLMTALAIPIAEALGAGRFRKAGLLIGVAILFKQTAAFLLLVVVAHVALRRGARQAALLFLAGSVPYVAMVLAFGILGAAGDALRWTMLVPLTVRPASLWYQLPDTRSLAMLLLAFAPLAVEAALEREGEYPTGAGWHLTVAAGFALIALPRFGTVQTVAALPNLSIGVARLLAREGAWLRATALAFVATLTLSQAAVVAAGESFDGKVVFWNDVPALERVVAALSTLPRDTPLSSELWENVLPRSGLLPPGGIYVNPLFAYFFPVDNIGERVRRAAQAPGTVVVGYSRPGLAGQIVGPYVIARR
jgi:hypothetical protein